MSLWQGSSSYVDHTLLVQCVTCRPIRGYEATVLLPYYEGVSPERGDAQMLCNGSVVWGVTVSYSGHMGSAQTAGTLDHPVVVVVFVLSFCTEARPYQQSWWRLSRVLGQQGQDFLTTTLAQGQLSIPLCMTRKGFASLDSYSIRLW